MGSFEIEKWSAHYRTILIVLSVALFPLAIGSVHLFDWDEVNFAEASREMIMNHNYFNVQINFGFKFYV